MPNLNKPLTLRNNSVIPNRLAKAAMSENLANKKFLPDTELLRLYEKFSASGAGLLITGNILLDPNSLGEPNNVVLEETTPLDSFKEWARVAKKNGSVLWGQINHPGRQSPILLSKQIVAPSLQSLCNPNYFVSLLVCDKMNKRNYYAKLQSGKVAE